MRFDYLFGNNFDLASD